jgi:signal transduction histidine kinase
LVTYSAGSEGLETALSHLDAFDEYAFAAVYQVEGDELALRAVRFIPAEEVGHPRIALGEGISGWVARHRKPVITGDARQDPRNTIGEGARTHTQAMAMAAFPLVSGGQVTGVLTVGKEGIRSIHREDARLLTIFANLLAAILRNQEHAQERERLAVVQERNRLAREIHDGLAQSLAGTILQMDRLDRLVEGDPRGARRLVVNLREHVRELLLEVRRSIYNLRPSPLAQNGLVESLRNEVDRLKEKGIAGSSEVRLEVRGPQRRLSGLLEDESFRIIQEGLTNAIKHAAATEIGVSVQFLEEQLRLSVRDNGKGFLLADAVRGARDRGQFGLLGMSERAERLGANFEVESRPGSGTRIIVEVPLMGE